jgi:hypothetical protein
MRPSAAKLVATLAGAQLADVAVTKMFPDVWGDEHLDELGVPQYFRPFLNPIKLVSTGGLLLGLKWPRLGALTATGLIAYYTIASSFHLRADESPMNAVSAVVFGLAAAATLVTRFIPAVRAVTAQ